MDNQFDSESYWNRSASKAFSFDDVDFETDDPSIGHGSSQKLKIFQDDRISEDSFDNPADPLDLSVKAIISDDLLNLLLKEQTLEDNELVVKGKTQEEELKLLRRHMQTTLYSRSPELTAYKLLLGKEVSLEAYKSLSEKQQLLDLVLKNGGGDAIISVLLFMKKTLKRQHFYSVFSQYPKAMLHYLSYIKERKNNEIFELLQMCGKMQEAALMQFVEAVKCNDLPTKKQNLCRLIDNYCNSTTVIPLYEQIFHSQLKLVELVEKERNSLDNLVDINSTPIEVLYACCRKHNNWKDADLLRTISPYRFATEHQITPAQFEWTALNERASSQAYGDLESIFEKEHTWLPMKQKQFHISFAIELAILRLHQLKAPTTVLYLFLSKTNNAAEKIELAKKVQCTKAVIDALVSLKDLTQLTGFRESLADRSEEQFYCDKAIKSLQTKRWSTDNIKIKL